VKTFHFIWFSLKIRQALQPLFQSVHIAVHITGATLPGEEVTGGVKKCIVLGISTCTLRQAIYVGKSN
jgi:hypothetical protein